MEKLNPALETCDRVSEVHKMITKEKMTLPQVLEALTTKVKKTISMPKYLTEPPWRISPGSTPHSATINRLLELSFEIQASVVPGSGDFDEFIASNANMAVCGLIKHYVGLICKQEDLVEICFGLLMWDDGYKEMGGGGGDYDGSPHLWLEIAGQPIDNTYTALPIRTEEFIGWFYKAKKASNYIRGDPKNAKDVNIYLGQEDDLKDTVRHNYSNIKRIYKMYGKNEHIEKYCVFSLSSSELNPCVPMYDILMRKKIKEGGFGVENELDEHNLLKKWANICWRCHKRPEPSQDGERVLLRCAKCKLAMYCDRECQKADWKMHKLMHEEIELTEKVLSREDNDS